MPPDRRRWIHRLLPWPRRRFVLALDLSRPVTDGAPGSPVARMAGARGPSLREVVAALEEAARDRRVGALVARVDAPADSWAHAQELAGAVRAFRASGKPTFAHAQTFSEAGDAVLAYLVASAFEEVHLQPTGEVGVVGVGVVQPFVADLLDKLGVVPQLDHRHEFKTAKNLLTERAFTEAHREAADRIVANLQEQLLDAVVGGRGLARDRAAELVDRAPLLAEEARDHHLVDRLAYRDQTMAAAFARVGPQARLLTLRQYVALLRRRQRPDQPTVALIHGRGAIQVGRGRPSPLGPVMGADTVVTAFQQAVRDQRVRAIVFRVDSGGGSAVASDAIRRAVAYAREAGTPVVVSMGSLAGSGGYWIAMDADRILASPATLTGSIGVVYGKLVARELRHKVGITTDEVHRGANALMFSSDQPFTDAQWDQVGQLLDRVYDDFVERVAAGRGLPREQVQQIARGRVWTGADARQRGLVDELGGYREAFAAARRLAGLPADARLRVRVLPRLPASHRLGLRPGAAAGLRAVLGRLEATVDDPAGAHARMPDWAGPAARPGR
ncbi:signal peptide peptidase SppA [Egicoccus sp. AB-alg2]|uniref:signal peptide peptidase SppA n=1 Tax=Egicoccus sp. AB-alg2 TaxID=3242693 RepID=UPI00359ED8B2